MKLFRDYLTKTPQPSHGSQIQRLRTQACAVSHAVSPAHGSTVDQPHNPKGYVILIVRARSNSPEPEHAGVAVNTPERKDRAAVRGSDSPALPLHSASGHQFDHGLVQNVTGTHAHVIGSQGKCSGSDDGRRRKGAARLLQGACEHANVH
jgi:hypothetical protein